MAMLAVAVVGPPRDDGRRADGGRRRLPAVGVILRCRAPRKRLRFDGDTCDGYVIDVPEWMGAEFVGLLAHSSLKRYPDSLAPTCARCQMVHEIALRGVVPYRSAA